MSEAAKAGAVGMVLGWLKAAVSGVLGLLSGAALMYVSPLVDQVVRPARPVANFALDVQGLNVTFENRAEGRDGWWDFGDGSALQPFSPEQKTITHAYARSGDYTARLTLRNAFGEENERSVTVHTESNSVQPPAIEALTIQPLDSDCHAPATFRLTAQLKGADLCVWACGADRPLEVVADPPATQERYVTFNEAGKYIVKVAAVQGKNVVEQSCTVQVKPAQGGVLAVVRVKAKTIRVKKTERHHNEKIALPAGFQGDVYAFRTDIPAGRDSQLIEAKIAAELKVPYLRNIKAVVAPSGDKVTLSGEFLPRLYPSQPHEVVPSWVIPLVLTQQRQGPAQLRSGDPLVARLTLPGTTTIPLPCNHTGLLMKQRQVELELYDGPQSIWQGSKLPLRTVLQVQNQPCQVMVTEDGDQLRIDLLPHGSSIQRTGYLGGLGQRLHTDLRPRSQRSAQGN